MRTSVSAKDLKDAIAWTAKVVKTHPHLPILANVLLTADYDGVRVAATNLDVALTRDVKATVTEGTAICVNAKSLKDYLRKAKGTVSIESYVEEGHKLPTVTLEASGIRITLPSADPEDYPLIPHDTVWDHAFPFEEPNLKQIAKFAAPPDEGRVVLTCVFVEVYNGEDYRYRLTAADGFRLVSTSPIDGEKVGEYLLPAKAAEMIAGLKAKGVLKLRAESGKRNEADHLWAAAEFTAGDSTVRSTLKEGRFPDYNQIIPASDRGTWATFNTAELAQKLEALAPVTHQWSHLVKLELHYDLATLSARDEDGNKANATVSAEWGGEERFAIAFNAKIMLDCLALCGEQTRMMFQDPTRAILIEGIGCQMVVMPMHIQR